MDAKAYVQDLVNKGRVAQKIFEQFSQEKIDRVCLALGKSIYDNAEILAKEAVEETGMGNVPSKIRKQQVVAMGHCDYILGKKSIGLIDDDKENKVLTYAKPIGVLACITPTTNPTSTIVGNGVYALKCANAIIVCPHPRAKNVSKHGVTLFRAAIEAAGGPADLLQMIEDPSVEKSQLLMQLCDANIATGGPGMVKAAYSSGRPSFGVGQGNVQTIIDEGMQDVWDAYAVGTMTTRMTDYGVQCNSEQTIHVPAKEKDGILAAFVKNGAMVVTDKAVIQKMRENLFTDKGTINPALVGKVPHELGKVLGLDVPPEVKVLIAESTGTADKDSLCKEKLCPVLACLPYDTFEQGLANVVANLNVEGKGHSSVVFSKNQDHIDMAAKAIPVARLAVNVANSVASGNSNAIGFNPTISLACGTWGNNSLSENLTFEHLRNVTKAAYVMPGKPAFDPAKIWAGF
ncbi:MAG: aldehyde dehydrogenase family protein [Deltaproteobacteria bacterium]|jgi:succinate-semialdehyde dehydrogenase|nr:aldehyde dehydrogenase family protein [Deltaproteobacteria bacterium]